VLAVTAAPRLERLEQGAVDRIALRGRLRMPLNTERKPRRVGDPDRLDGAVPPPRPRARPAPGSRMP